MLRSKTYQNHNGVIEDVTTPRSLIPGRFKQNCDSLLIIVCQARPRLHDGAVAMQLGHRARLQHAAPAHAPLVALTAPTAEPHGLC
jgi:hypothetical protein